MKKFFFLAVAAILLYLPQQAMAASNPDMEKADYFYRHGSYANAIGYYEKVVKKAPRRKDAELHAKLADCYRLIRDPAQAAAWYARAITAPRKVTKEMKLHYGEVLMNLQQYDTAAKMLRQYAALTPGDRRAANMIRGCEAAKAMMQESPEGIARLLSINTDQSDIGPAIFGGSLAFTSDSLIGGAAKKDNWTGQHYYNIYKVDCTPSGECGTNIEQISGKLNIKYHDGTPVFTGNGQQMYFTRTFVQYDVFGINPVADQSGKVHLEIMIAEDYDPAEKKFKKIREFPYNNRNYSTTHPAISPDGSTLVFASDMSGGAGATDLYQCRKEADGSWGKPASLGNGINTEGEEMFPVFLDNNTISFASTGHPGMGGLDVFYSTRNPRDGSWGAVTNAGMPVNSSWDDMSLVMYADARNGYFASNRPAARKSDNIYHYLRQRLFLHLKIADAATGNGLEGAEVSLKDLNGDRSLTSGPGGSVTGPLTPQPSYTVTVRRKGYSDLTTILKTDDLTRAVDTLDRTLLMTSNSSISYTARILDEQNGEPVANPLLVITKDGSPHADTVDLATGDIFRRAFEPGATYRINAIKENYYSDEKIVSTGGFDLEKGFLSISDTLLMCKLSVGAVCQIENILYDFDKSEIRADATASLDKVIKLMREHPSLKLQINSHTDCRGTGDYNMRLSKERADVVIKYLGSKGINMKRLQARGFGATAPVFNCPGDCADCAEEGRQRNRRTEFSVLAL